MPLPYPNHYFQESSSVIRKPAPDRSLGVLRPLRWQDRTHSFAGRVTATDPERKLMANTAWKRVRLTPGLGARRPDDIRARALELAALMGSCTHFAVQREAGPLGQGGAFVSRVARDGL